MDLGKGKKGKGTDQKASFLPTGHITDYCNEKVKGIYNDLAPYEIPKFKDSVPVENKELVALQNDGKYEGQWSKSDNLRHGIGIQVWTDGSIYEGHWKNDKADGDGRLIHADGDVYEGAWVVDKAEGKGTYTHQDGAQYAGEWRDDKQHGKGVETWPDNARYEGDYIEGKKHG